jgi:hypothetical protein
MIERLDPFNLPQQGADRLALSTAAPKVEKTSDSSARPSRAPRQRDTKAPRRK